MPNLKLPTPHVVVIHDNQTGDIFYVTPHESIPMLTGQTTRYKRFNSDNLIHQIDWLFAHQTELTCKAYVIDMVNTARAEMARLGRSSILLEWSHNQAVILERCFNRHYYQLEGR